MKIESKTVLTSNIFHNPNQIIIFLHGYGSKGDDFSDIVINNMLDKFNDTVFLFPDAPYDCEAGFNGKQWFSLHDLSYEGIRRGIESSNILLAEYIKNISNKYKVNLNDISLVGFSQGTIMSYEMIYHLPLKKIVAISGLFVAIKNMDIKSKNDDLEVLIIHGDNDNVVPYNNVRLSSESLNILGIKHDIFTCHGLGHNISQEGIKQIIDFINN